MTCIYLAEDTPDDALIVKAVLRSHGSYQVREFGDGLSLLQAVQEEPPDLVMLDIILPLVTGLAVARLLRFHDDTRHIPILMSSSITDADIRQQAQAAGADAFVPKPVDMATMKAELTRLLETRTAR